MTTDPWSGRKVGEARAVVAQWLPMQCGRCPELVDGTEPWVVGHKIARSIRPDLTFEVTNWQPEHRSCSNSSAQQAVQQKAYEKGVRDAQSGQIEKNSSFSQSQTYRQPPHLPVSPSQTQSGPKSVREELLWDPERLKQFKWLQPLLDVPENASPPLWMSRPPADAVGSYGAEAIRWIEKTQNITLRWWQKLSITRQLEHRSDGSLCHREILESAPRRAGKSVRLRGLALWRMEWGPLLFGESQLVMHTGSDVAICREIQRGAWRWAEDEARWKVTRANGKEAIETRKGDRWLVRAQNAVYGYDVTLGAVDEAWDVKPDTVTEGLEPATLERSSPQMHLTSTAHRRATSLMRGRLSAALSSSDPATLLLVWAAPAGSDPGDPEVWRAASPHWTEDRRKLIASKYEKALAGESDAELDDPDPMEGFKAQYLNIWRLKERRLSRGSQVIEESTWNKLTTSKPTMTPRVAAIENWFTEGCSVALGWRLNGKAVISVTDHPDLESAARAIVASGFKGKVIVGTSLVDDPALKGLRKDKMSSRTVAMVTELGRLISEDAIRHDGSEHLTKQVLAVRTAPSTDGPRLLSSHRSDGLKAAVWAANAVRAQEKNGKPRILLPS